MKSCKAVLDCNHEIFYTPKLYPPEYIIILSRREIKESILCSGNDLFLKIDSNYKLINKIFTIYLFKRTLTEKINQIFSLHTVNIYKSKSSFEKYIVSYSVLPNYKMLKTFNSSVDCLPTKTKKKISSSFNDIINVRFSRKLTNVKDVEIDIYEKKQLMKEYGIISIPLERKSLIENTETIFLSKERNYSLCNEYRTITNFYCNRSCTVFYSAALNSINSNKELSIYLLDMISLLSFPRDITFKVSTPLSSSQSPVKIRNLKIPKPNRLFIYLISQVRSYFIPGFPYS